MRYSEEVVLLAEEMRRVLQFLQWHATWWEARMYMWEGLSAEDDEGMVAYAKRQASLRLAMRADCLRLWADVPRMLGLGRRHPDVGGVDRILTAVRHFLTSQFCGC
jgi:hypothetical protein